MGGTALRIHRVAIVPCLVPTVPRVKFKGGRHNSGKIEQYPRYLKVGMDVIRISLEGTELGNQQET